MKKTIKVVNPAPRKRKRKNPLLIQSPFRRIKKTGSYTANPRKRKVCKNSLTKGKETPTMAATKRHHRKHHNPVVFANRRHHRRHKNPEGGVQMSGAGITSVLMDGLIVGGSMVGVNWLTNFIQEKLFAGSTSPWMKYAVMAAVSLLGGWAIGKANARVGKDFAAAGVGLTILNIANEQLTFLKLGTTPLKGDEDEGPVLGELTLSQLATANAMKDNLLGAGPFQQELVQADDELEGESLGQLELIEGDEEFEGSAFEPSFQPGVSY